MRLIILCCQFVACSVLFILFILSDIPGTLYATISPKSGQKFPQAYLNRLRTTPGAFTYKRAYIQTVKRIQANMTAVADGRMTAVAAATAGGTVVSGVKSIPVFTAMFANTAAQPYPVSDLQTELFDGPWPTGTMKEYYEEISYGAFSVTGTVFDWVTLANNDTHYEGASNGLGADAEIGEFIEEVLDANDAAVDFAQYDNDGPDGVPNSGDDDGFVDFVAFVHPEDGGECGGGSTNIWSHRFSYSAWTGSEYTTNDAAAGGGFIRVDDYVIMPAFSCPPAGGMIEIGVFCHEFGHAFGLPDLYDTDGSSEGIGHWGLMASGNWNTPSSPAHMSAWSKIELGWISPVNIASNQNAKIIANVEDSPVVYKLEGEGDPPDGMPDGQYFLIENRQKIGFDQDLHEAGLLIWHVDENVINANLSSNTVNTDEDHPGIDLEQADGNRDLNNGNNRGDAGDPFPGNSDNHNFTTTDTPNSNAYEEVQVKVYLAKISDLQDPMIADLKVTPILNLIDTILAIIFTCLILIWMLKRKGFLTS